MMEETKNKREKIRKNKRQNKIKKREEECGKRR